ncbi:hypothetical protein DCAR_0205613 [Daucus carota subsp. sativus]|uniref:Uncharacterized protein n=1 Tax=Daucus carota subsp. sativus TaxID=79200 RepID=A0A175YCV7_DAUCS|nr:hypothetical protein DCAR_0205613 [Daucus carota subsp. sativus]
MEARYRKACLGYARIREKIIQEKTEKGENDPIVTRLDAWEYARRKVNDIVDDPVAVQLLKDVVVISDQLAEDKLTNIGTDDLLSRINTIRAFRMSESNWMGGNKDLIKDSIICE